MSDTKEKAISREQKRRMDRINTEAQATINVLMGQFLAFLMVVEDPEGEEAQIKRSQLGAKWRTYCKHKGLTAESRPILDKYMDECMKDYLKEKNPEPIQP